MQQLSTRRTFGQFNTVLKGLMLTAVLAYVMNRLAGKFKPRQSCHLQRGAPRRGGKLGFLLRFQSLFGSISREDFTLPECRNMCFGHA